MNYSNFKYISEVIGRPVKDCDKFVKTDYELPDKPTKTELFYDRLSKVEKLKQLENFKVRVLWDYKPNKMKPLLKRLYKLDCCHDEDKKKILYFCHNFLNLWYSDEEKEGKIYALINSQEFKDYIIDISKKLMKIENIDKKLKDFLPPDQKKIIINMIKKRSSDDLRQVLKNVEQYRSDILTEIKQNNLTIANDLLDKINHSRIEIRGYYQENYNIPYEFFLKTLDKNEIGHENYVFLSALKDKDMIVVPKEEGHVPYTPSWHQKFAGRF